MDKKTRRAKGSTNYMGNIGRRHDIFILLTIISCVLAPISCCSAAQEIQVANTQTSTTVLTPQGLSSKEQSQMEQQYRFGYRDKGKLLEPYVSADSEVALAESVEQERLYRYFGTAMGLYKDGKLGETAEVLRYILDKNPDDGYVKNYLDRVLRERDAQEKKWQDTSRVDSDQLKESRLKNLLIEGIDCYKQERYETALLKFADLLALDPDNEQAKQYMEKLKEYYAKEGRIEDIIKGFEYTNKADSEDTIVKEVSPGGATVVTGNGMEGRTDDRYKAAENILNQNDIETVVMEKRLSSFMDRAELSLKVEDIIERRKLEEERDRVYTLGSGDTVQISVRDHPELSGRALVRLSGEIVLPLVNDVVMIKNMTLEESSQKITDSMKRYVKDPFVTLTIDEYKSKTFFVIDELGCTPYPITRANITLRDALFISDWGDDRALGRVVVMKPHRLHPVVKKVDAFDIIYRGNLANNIRIEDGDVIYVPLTAAAKITKTIADTLKPFSAVRSARDEWINQKGDMKSYAELPRIRVNTTDEGHSLWDGAAFPTSVVGVASQ